MADEWQLEAVHEQFDVFERLQFMNNHIRKTDILQLVKIITKDYQTYKEENTVESWKIAKEIEGNVPSKENKLTLTFAVVVLDKKKDNKLCKIPVFSLLSESQCIFIDINCTVFDSWPAFMENNDLRSVQFCFPVNGVYNVKGNLKIDFGKASGSLSRRFFRPCGCLTSYVTIASTYIFKIPQTVFNAATKVAEIAREYFPSWLTSCGVFVGILSCYVGHFFVDGVMSIAEFIMETGKILLSLITGLKDKTVCALEGVRRALGAMYHYVQQTFSNWFFRASSESQHSIVAATNQIDGEIYKMDSEFENELASVNGNAEVFENCKKECALGNGNKFLSGKTVNLTAIGASIARKLDAKNLDEAKDLFVNVSTFVKSEYENKMHLYLSMVKSLKNANKGFAVKLANKSLGITGKATDHYWKEALDDLQNSPFLTCIEQKLNEVNVEKSNIVVNVWKESEPSINGLYKITGVEGNGKISVSKLKKELKKQSIAMNNNWAVNKTDSLILLRSKHMMVMLAQEVDERTNTADGLIFVNKF